MQTMFCCYYFKRSFSFQVFFDGLQLCLCTILRVPVSLLKCRSSFLLVQRRPFSHVASIDSNSASCFVLAHPSFGACPRSSQSRLCAYFPSGHSYAPSLIDSVSLFSLSLKKGAYHRQGSRGVLCAGERACSVQSSEQTVQVNLFCFRFSQRSACRVGRKAEQHILSDR